MPRNVRTDPAVEKPPTTIDRLREMVSIRVQATSLRSVARQVGMSPSGLEKFLQGGMPYSGSRRKLYDWYTREGSQLRSDLTADGISAALGRLVQDLPDGQRAPAMAGVLEVLMEAYDAQGAVPAWLHDLAARGGAGAGAAA